MEFFAIIGIIIGIIWLFNALGDNSHTNSKNSKYYSSSQNRHHYSHTPKTTYRNTNLPRAKFNELKNTETFKKWKKAQYDCQDGKCAWCQCHLDLHSPYTQVDHIKPLCQGGSPTDFDNFVLACKSCNYYCKKGNYTWRDRNGTVHNGWTKPSWIHNNPIATTTKNNEYDPIDSYDLSEITF